jgi:hypothetical protein
MTAAGSVLDGEGAQASRTEDQRNNGEATTAITASITLLRWGRTVNVGNYSSVRLDAEAVVGTDGSVESTLEALQNWVDVHLPIGENEYTQLISERDNLIADMETLRFQHRHARDEVQKLKRFFAVNQLDWPYPSGEDLPF